MSINPPFCDVGTALEEIRAGRMIVVIDDEDRENEGDLTMAAEKITPDCAVNAGSEWKIGSNRRAATGRGDTVSFYQRRSRLFSTRDGLSRRQCAKPYHNISTG
jgi:hypothetical protein